MHKTYQIEYYYQTNECKAKNVTDEGCVCWHKKGTGVHPQENEIDNYRNLSWRLKEIREA
jgi:hypothetical protein